MNSKGDGELIHSRQPEAAVQDGDDGGKDCSGRQGAGMKILVGERDADAGQGKGQQDGHGGHGGPLGPRLGEASAADPPRTVEKQKDRSDLPQEDAVHASGRWSEANGECDDLIEDCGLELQGRKNSASCRPLGQGLDFS